MRDLIRLYELEQLMDPSTFKCKARCYKHLTTNLCSVNSMTKKINSEKQHQQKNPTKQNKKIHKKQKGDK